MKRGVLHVHSTFSDGENTLERLVELFRQSDISFVAVSDHAEVFDQARMEQYVRLCESLSDSRFLVIPGLEFALPGGYLHILGYGIGSRIRFNSMEELVDGIHGAGGIAILAHPPAGSTNIIGPIKAKLDGIEIWNARYDGVHAPRTESFQLLRRIRAQNSAVSAYCGIDLHKFVKARKPLYVDVDVDQLGRYEIIGALRSGKFTVRGGKTAIPSSGNLTFIQQIAIAMKQPLCRPAV